MSLFSSSFGYTNISWSLGSDVTARHVSKLIKKMDRDGVDYVYVHPAPGQKLEPRKLTNLTSNYLKRAEKNMPKQGGTGPWYQKENWFLDTAAVTLDRLNDPTLIYKKAPVSA
jgi:monooxygenase